eukprot:TRINITY_DN2282_c0_g1_i2.p1 TRINITY_DN2282_c0_g1~~TRINITY_DN2282_c0_g1_i2.p1  ORF type:complete len:351 (+),score=44.31 TRINITY_DN2282_c0_g1_i2:156-1208(+)
MSGRAAFLEGHLAKKLNDKASALQHVTANRPAFPPPEMVVTVRDPHVIPPSLHDDKDKVGEEKAATTSETKGGGKNFISFTASDDLNEYRDAPDVVRAKCALLAEYIKQASNTLIFTGAGISTASKLPDYRSKDKGIWVLKEKGEAIPNTIQAMEDASPTLAHMVVEKLVERQSCKAVISTNIDGLHMKSGVPFESLIELHGNSFVEICNMCGQPAIRDFCTAKGVEHTESGDHSSHHDEDQHHGHDRRRKCTCGGDYRDSIIHFGEPLRASELQRAYELIQHNDLSLVLGSSLRVSPSCNLPRKVVDNMGKMIVVNLQKTPFEDETWLHIYSDIDEVMAIVADQLHINI